ncbi:MAG: hypothetical protein FWC58_04105 [Desulfobulbus sp.]|nr:hypothetical protein [Desulfobulbus sp.]
MNEKAEFAARLKQALVDAGYEPRPSVLEKGFNSRYWGRSVSLQAVSQWLNGQAIPAQDKLQTLAEWLNVEPHVLRFGSLVNKKVQARRQRWDEGIGHQEREVFEDFLKLSAPERKIVREVILAFVRGQPTEGKG